jgi:repressor LexA
MKATCVPTERQRMVLLAIHIHQLAYRRPPSLRELAKMLEIKTAQGVQVHILALENKGLITRRPRAVQSIQLTEYGHHNLYQQATKTVSKEP